MKKVRKKRSWIRNTMAFIVSFVMCLGFMPTVVHAADPSITMKEQTVTYTGEEIRFPNAGITIDGMSASDTVHYYYSNNLSSGQTPVFTENSYPTYCGRYRVYATITDKNGTPLANSGNATSFVIVPKAVTFEAATNEKPYDGTPLVDDTYILRSELGKGDSIGNVTVVGTQTPVGSSPNKITNAAVMKGDKDVSSNYSFTFVDGTLTVTEKASTATLKDKTAEYSASPIAIEPATVTGSSSAPVYHYYSDKELKNELSGAPSDAGTYYVKAKVAADSLYGPAENDPAATLTITPRNATITADDATKTWDGSPLTNDQWHATGILAGQEIESITVTGSQQDVGSSKNTPANAKVVDSTTGKDVTNNYNITYTPGTLTVVEATPAIVVADKTVVYDGTEVASNPATVTNVKVPWNPSELTYNYYDDDYRQPLPAGELPKDAGVYRVVVTWADPSNTYTLPDGTATITILKRGDPGPDPQNPLPEVTVTAPSAEKVYDGTPLTKNDPKDSVAVNLAPGHKISDKTVITGTQTEVGESPNIFTSIVIEDANGNDVTKNYQFTPKGGTPGTLKVTPASPEIILDPKTEVFTGKPIPIDPGKVTTPKKGDPIDPDDVVYKYYADPECKKPVDSTDPTNPPTDTGTYYVTGTTPGSKNYASITSDPVELTILPVKISISTGSKIEPYVGKPLTYDYYDYPTTDLISGHAITEFIVNGKQEGVGTSKNHADKLSLVIKDENAVDVTKNYEVTIIEGDLTLYTAPELKITGKKTLTGDKKTEDITDGQFTFTISSDKNNDASGFIGLTSPVSVKAGGDIDFGTLSFVKEGTYKFTITENDLAVRDYTYDAASYEIVVVAAIDQDTGKLEKDVTMTSQGTKATSIEFVNTYKNTNPLIDLDPKEETYTGKPIPIDPGKVTIPDGGKPIDPDDVVYKYYEDEDCKTPVNPDDPTTPPTDTGTYYVTGTTPGTDTYDPITSTPVKLVITPVKVTITTGSKTEGYTGKPLTYDKYDVTTGTLNPGDKIVEFDITGKQEEVGSSKNTADKNSIVIKNDKDEDVTKNYDITISEGTLTITPTDPTIDLDPKEETYTGKPIPIDPGKVTIPDGGKPIDPDDVVYKYYEDEDCKTPVNPDDPTTPPTNPGTYYVTGTTPGTDTYNPITSTPVKLVITPVKVTITTGSKTEEYTGKPLTYDHYDITTGTLNPGDKIVQITITGKQEDVGSSKNTVDKTSIVIHNDKGEDVTKYYDLTIDEGKLTLTDNPQNINPSPNPNNPNSNANPSNPSNPNDPNNPNANSNNPNSNSTTNQTPYTADITQAGLMTTLFMMSISSLAAIVFMKKRHC